MEENKIETPLSEVDSNVNAEETVVTNETESNVNTGEEETFELQKQELMDMLGVLESYRAARRVGERRQVSKQENKKKKAKRRMAKKSKR